MTRKILLIDDDPDIHELVRIGLEHAHWQVLLAQASADGIALAREHQPDAILLDFMMPGMDGPTVCRMLRSDPATHEIPVVLLTAKSLDARTLENVSVTAVIGKPFHPMRLAKKMTDLLRWGQDP